MFSIYDLQKNQREILLLLSNIVNAISIGFLIAFFIFTNRKKEILPGISFLMRNLFFANLIYCFSNLLSNISDSHHNICIIEGFFRQFSLSSILVWGAILSRVIYFKISHNFSYLTTSQNLQYFLGYGIPCFTAIIPLLGIGNLQFKFTEAFCWIYHDDQFKYKIYSLLILYLWIWACIIFITYNTFKAVHLLSEYDFGNIDLAYSRLIAYPLILYLIFIPETIDWFELWPDEPFLFACLYLLLSRSIGFFNVITYGLQRLKEGYNKQVSLSMAVVNDEDVDDNITHSLDETKSSKYSIKDLETCDSYFRQEDY